MRLIITTAILFGAIWANAQTKMIPGKNTVEKKWLKNQDYQMTWSVVKDTARLEIGKTTTQILHEGNKIIVVTIVSMKQGKSPWIDSTIADADDLSPVYHSSFNGQREMVLHFGKIVTGYHYDKIKNVRTEISDTTKEDYFDSNLYPTLITWLPLQKGYKRDISIYDYTPSGKSGVIKASIQDVKKGIYKSKKSGEHAIWIVTISDEISGGENGFSTYYIDCADRRLWKQQIDAGGRMMEMELLEN